MATTADTFRTQMHQTWASVADAWRDHAEFIEGRAAAVTEKMLELSEVQPGNRVLELACGAGGLGLAAASRVAPGGEVVLSDVVPEMVASAMARAEMLDVANVSSAVLDMEEIEQPDSSYDVVLCREGLMFTLDPARAVREIHRVLSPGGRVVVAVWASPEHNPWLSVVIGAVSAQLGHPVPPPGMPGPFSLCDAGQLANLLTDGGLEDGAVREMPAPMRVSSFEEWWTRTCALAGPLSNLLAALPADALEAISDQARAAARAYETADGLEFPGMTLVASGRRAAT